MSAAMGPIVHTIENLDIFSQRIPVLQFQKLFTELRQDTATLKSAFQNDTDIFNSLRLSNILQMPGKKLYNKTVSIQSSSPNYLHFLQMPYFLNSLRSKFLQLFWGKTITYCFLKYFMKKRTNQHLACGWIRALSKKKVI